MGSDREPHTKHSSMHSSNVDLGLVFSHYTGCPVSQLHVDFRENAMKLSGKKQKSNLRLLVSSFSIVADFVEQRKSKGVWQDPGGAEETKQIPTSSLKN